LWDYYRARDQKHAPKPRPNGFWKTVALIEVMDIAFAVDSILAAVALTPKFWLVFAGGMLGVLLIRFAAGGFLKLLEKFPGFESTAYLLVLVIGLKLGVDWLEIPGINFHSSSSPGFWVFWGSMVACIGWGFRPQRRATA
jgi:YkoY family integral membrane protein